MTRHSIYRFFVSSLCILLFLAIGTGILAYEISPLRDPSLAPMSANEGATIDWLNCEKYWWTLASVFSILLPTNIVVLAWLRILSKNPRLTVGRNRNLSNLLPKLLNLLGLWIMMVCTTWIASILFLLQQWIID